MSVLPAATSRGGVNGIASAVVVPNTFKLETQHALEVVRRPDARQPATLQRRRLLYIYHDMQYIETDPVPFDGRHGKHSLRAPWAANLKPPMWHWAADCAQRNLTLERAKSKGTTTHRLHGSDHHRNSAAPWRIWRRLLTIPGVGCGDRASRNIGAITFRYAGRSPDPSMLPTAITLPIGTITPRNRVCVIEGPEGRPFSMNPPWIGCGATAFFVCFFSI